MSKSKLLRLGDKGSDVREVQKSLTRLGYPLKVDGTFRRSTDLAVRHFQAKSGLKVDGIVGPNTRRELYGVTPPVLRPPSQEVKGVTHWWENAIVPKVTKYVRYGPGRGLYDKESQALWVTKGPGGFNGGVP